MVANPEVLGAIAYNSAAMAFHDKSSVALGALFINVNLSVENAARQERQRGPPVDDRPHLPGRQKVNDQWRIGLGANYPVRS